MNVIKKRKKKGLWKGREGGLRFEKRMKGQGKRRMSEGEEDRRKARHRAR